MDIKYYQSTVVLKAENQAEKMQLVYLYEHMLKEGPEFGYEYMAETNTLILDIHKNT